MSMARGKTLVMLIGVAGLFAACSGDRGKVGPAGSQGPVGATCTATDNLDGTFTIDCGGDIVTVSDGAPAAACTATDNLDGTYTIMCGTDEVIVTDGKDGTATDRPEWTSADPNSRRVHSVHRGAELNFPNTTVAHSDVIAGRNWQIHYPQDIRNCETCHPAGDTSGTWKTNPNRLACWGCHDSEAAQSHFTMMTWDPTPAKDYSGDEVESCVVCHGDGGESAVGDRHGEDYLLRTGEFTPCGPDIDPAEPEDCNKSFATIDITAATADANGLATVTFKVLDADGEAITTFNPATPGWQSDLQFAIVALEPASSTATSYSLWSPYIVTKITVPSAGAWPNAAGTFAYMGDREDIDAGTLDLSDAANGNYTYTFAVDLDTILTDVDGDPILDQGGTAIASTYVPYDRTWTHRVAVWTGGHEGPTAAATYDFQPSTGNTTGIETRDIVQTAACQECHGETEFHGHGGDRLIIEDCNMCHNESYRSPFNDESLGMAVMIHKIHAGGELESIPGPDGIVWDDPETTADESADNGSYVIYRERRGNVNTYEWWNTEFPAVIENCTKCHTGAGADVNNWKEVPSRDVCGSCHDTIDWAETDPLAAGFHLGDAQADDADCTTCHKPDTSITAGMSVVDGHDWVTHDPRLTPEFDVELTVSGKAGSHFVAGESPTVTVVIKDKTTGVAIDHTTVIKDTDGAEGCSEEDAAADSCPNADGAFTQAYLFIHGPRARRNPVLGTSSYASVASKITGPFDLSAADATLDLVIDGGKAIVVLDTSGGDSFAAGKFSVEVDADAFSDVAAATASEVVAWLNADDAFAARAIAWLDDGMVAVRSRNLGTVFSLQLEPCAVGAAVFGGDTSTHYVTGGSYPRNYIYQFADAADNDPKATWTTANITYALDAVDDLMPGTYVVSVEIADRGRVDASDFWTPAVGWTTFQVGTDDPEPAVAGNCDLCHQSSPGRGFILDPARHNKFFGDDAMDQCGACHDYQPYR